MGQASSIPADTKGRNLSPIHPPEGWKDQGEDFQLISPISDLSNPSQFRHRVPQNMPQTQAVKRSARRTSKVCTGKTPPRRRPRALPPPQKFYFPNGVEVEGEDDIVRNSKMQPRWKVCRRRWQTKCHKARRRVATLANCHKQKKDHEAELAEKQPKRHPEILHRRLTDTTSAKEEDDPLLGLTVNKASFDASVSALQDVTINRFAMLDHRTNRNSTDTDQGTINRMAPYAQLLEAATTSPPQPRQDESDEEMPHDEFCADSVRKNRTEDSVLLGSMNSSSSLSDSCSESEEKNVTVTSFQPVWREQQQVANIFQHSQSDYLERLVDRTNSSTVEDESSSEDDIEEAVNSSMQSPVAALFPGSAMESLTAQRLLDTSVDDESKDSLLILEKESSLDAKKESLSTTVTESTVVASRNDTAQKVSLSSEATQPTVVLPNKNNTQKTSLSSEATESTVVLPRNNNAQKESLPSEATAPTIVLPRNSKPEKVSRSSETTGSTVVCPRKSKTEKMSLSSEATESTVVATRKASNASKPIETVADGFTVSQRKASVESEDTYANQSRKCSLNTQATQSTVVVTKKASSVEPRRSSLSMPGTLFSSDDGEFTSPGMRPLSMGSCEIDATKRASVLSEVSTDTSGSRIARLRQQYQRKLEQSKEGRVSGESKPAEEKENMKKPQLETKTKKLHQRQSETKDEQLQKEASREEKQHRGRSKHRQPFPHRRSSLQTRKKKVRGSVRSFSSPAKLSHARRSSVTTRETIQLPGLLHMAGWKEPPKKTAFAAKQEKGPTLPTVKEVEKAKPENKQVNVTKPKEQNPPAILKRRSDPTPSHRTGSGVTTAAMLKQTYSFSQDFLLEKKQELENTRQSAPCAMQNSDYRCIALGGQIGSPLPARSTTLVDAESPCLSVDSTNTTGSVPMLSQQAMFNAAFLFSPSYVGGDEAMVRPQRTSSSHADDMSFSITTMGSRARVSTAVEAVTIPARRSSSLSSETISRQSDRRVRFSDADDIFAIENRSNKSKVAVENKLKSQPEAVDIPMIESKLSDLTEATVPEVCESRLSANSIDPIPEETESAVRVSFASEEENSLTIFEDERELEDQPSSLPSMQWVYSKGGGMDSGVTPLRSGKSVAQATNSPYLRFQKARTKFNNSTVPLYNYNSLISGAPSFTSEEKYESSAADIVSDNATEEEAAKEEERVEEEVEEVVPVEQAKSPVKKSVGSLVHSRIAAMEEASGRLVLGEGGVLQPAPTEPTRKPMVTTVASKAVFLKTANKTESSSRTYLPKEEISLPFDEKDRQSIDGRSPTLINGEVVDSRGPRMWRLKSTKESLDESKSFSSTDRDDFAAIMHPSTLDSESEDAGEALTDLFKTHRAVMENDRSMDDSLSDDEDDFDALLNFQQDDCDEDDYSEAGETVSTIRQDKPMKLGSQFSSYRLSMGDQSTASSLGETVSTVRQIRESLESSLPASSSNIVPPYASWKQHQQQSRLPFREKAPGVKPNELAHKSPLKPRTWRALAEAAQARKESKRNILGV